jgi:enoyl-CoA hydratase
VTGRDPAFWSGDDMKQVMAKASGETAARLAAELFFTGRIVDAFAAQQMRLVSRVVPHVELMSTALVLAHEIAANPPLAVQRIKRGLRAALDPDWGDLGRWVTSSLAELFRTEDDKEGVAAFLEKRETNCVGR